MNILYKIKGNKKPAILISIVVSVFTTITAGLSIMDEGSFGRIAISSLIFGFVLVFLILRSVIRSGLTMYDSFMVYKKTFGEKETEYSSISSVSVVKANRGMNNTISIKRYFVIAKTNGDTIKIPNLLFRGTKNKNKFLVTIKESNSSVVFDEECIGIMESDSSLHDIEEILFLYVVPVMITVVAVISVVFIGIPILFYVIFEIIVGIYNNKTGM